MVRYAQTLETRVHEAFRGQGLLSLLHHLAHHHHFICRRAWAKLSLSERPYRTSPRLVSPIRHSHLAVPGATDGEAGGAGQAAKQELPPSAGGSLATTEATSTNSTGRQRLTDHRRSVGAWGWWADVRTTRRPALRP